MGEQLKPTLQASSWVMAYLGGVYSIHHYSLVVARAGVSLCAVSFLADMDECEDPAVQCLGGECRNTPGSYECHCQAGFELINGTVCTGTNPIPSAL